MQAHPNDKHTLSSHIRTLPNHPSQFYIQSKLNTHTTDPIQHPLPTLAKHGVSQ